MPQGNEFFGKSNQTYLSFNLAKDYCFLLKPFNVGKKLSYVKKIMKKILSNNNQLQILATPWDECVFGFKAVEITSFQVFDN